MSASEGHAQDKAPPPLKKPHQFRHSESDSESDVSEDSYSAAAFSTVSSVKNNDTASTSNQKTPAKGRSKSQKSRSQRNEWEIIGGLRDGQKFEGKPEKYEGYMSKRRRWPMKGWHKRYFMLDKGILYYGKNSSDIQKGKYHGVIDIGLSVIAFKKQRQRIDIDAEDLIYHIKVKKNFGEWISRLSNHRLYRQHEINFGTKESPRLTEIATPLIETVVPIMATMNLPDKVLEKSLPKQMSLSRHASLKGQDRVATWVLDTQGFEHCNKGLQTAQNLLYELNKDLEAIRTLPLNTDMIDLSESETSDKKKSKYFVGRPGKRKDHKRNSSLQSNEPVGTFFISNLMQVGILCNKKFCFLHISVLVRL